MFYYLAAHWKPNVNESYVVLHEKKRACMATKIEKETKMLLEC